MPESLHDILFNSHKADIQEFEQLGEDVVRFKLADGSFAGNRRLASEWLQYKQQLRQEERSNKALHIAERASSDARSARIIAIIAATIAAIATIISAFIKANSP